MGKTLYAIYLFVAGLHKKSTLIEFNKSYEDGRIFVIVPSMPKNTLAYTTFLYEISHTRGGSKQWQNGWIYTQYLKIVEKIALFYL